MAAPTFDESMTVAGVVATSTLQAGLESPSDNFYITFYALDTVPTPDAEVTVQLTGEQAIVLARKLEQLAAQLLRDSKGSGVDLRRPA